MKNLIYKLGKLLLIVCLITLCSCNKDYDPLNGTAWSNEIDGKSYRVVFDNSICTVYITGETPQYYIYDFMEGELILIPEVGTLLTMSLTSPEDNEMYMTITLSKFSILMVNLKRE